MNRMTAQDLAWVQSKTEALRSEMARTLVGQKDLVDGLLTALLCSQHILIEGVPGLAKTLAVKVLSGMLGLDFQRIQFTPDLLPSDLVGTQVFQPQSGNFSVKKGPVFTSLLLADEINRAPAKVQSALLEAMEERQVTLGEETFPLPDPFLVLATQNPLEQEGTYSLPEAQLDRFMFKIQVKYPSREEELEILRRKKLPAPRVNSVLSRDDLGRLRDLTAQVHLEPALEEHIVDLVRGTRSPQDERLASLLRWGAGPRAVYFLLWASRGAALLDGRDYVVPGDIQRMAAPVLRHRLILSYEALAEGTTVDQVISALIAGLPQP